MFSSLCFLLVLGFALLGFSVPAVCQASRENEGVKVLKTVDGRLYRASCHGLKALCFTFRPEINNLKGRPLKAASFRVRYLWREGVGDRVDYLDDKGTLRAHLDELGVEGPHPENLKKRRQIDTRFYLLHGRLFRLQFLGRTLLERFGKHRLRVFHRKVNDRDEISIQIEPRHPVRLKRLTIILDRNGLPWKRELRLTSGWYHLYQYAFLKRPEGYLIKSYQLFATPPDGTRKGFNYAVAFSYQRAGGFLLPATIKKSGHQLPARERGMTNFQDLLVNQKVPAFKPQKMPPPLRRVLKSAGR